MPASTTALNAACDAIAGPITKISLHTEDPGAAGTLNELSGGSYDRGDVDYNAASDGTATIEANVVINGPGSSSIVTHIGFWADDTFYGSAALSASKTIGPGDTLTITAASITVA